MTTLGQRNLNERKGTPPLDELVLRTTQGCVPYDCDSVYAFHAALLHRVTHAEATGLVPTRYIARLVAQVMALPLEEVTIYANTFPHNATGVSDAISAWHRQEAVVVERYLSDLRLLLGSWAEGIY